MKAIWSRQSCRRQISLIQSFIYCEAMIEMVSLGRSKSNLHLCFVIDGPFSYMLLHIAYGSNKIFFIPLPMYWHKYGNIGFFFKDSQKILSKYGIFLFFFANTLGVLGKGLYFQLFWKLFSSILPFFITKNI